MPHAVLRSRFLPGSADWISPPFPVFQVGTSSLKRDLSLSIPPSSNWTERRDQAEKLTSQIWIYSIYIVHIQAIFNQQFKGLERKLLMYYVTVEVFNYQCNIPVGQRICCISCRWRGKWSLSKWRWWGTPSERSTNKRGPLRTKSLCQRHHGTALACLALMTQSAFPPYLTSRGRCIDF